MMGLIVRPMHVEEIQQMISYFHQLGEEKQRGMGVDPPKLPKAEDWIALLRDDFDETLDRRKFFYTTWELDGEPIGHCNVNKIQYGESAFMHLHVWKPELRSQGLGTEAARRSIEIFFDVLRLRRLNCEPYAENEPPNRALPRIGFRHVESYETTPGWINFHQRVNRWCLERSSVDARPLAPIETERLLLREFELGDAEVVFELATDPDVTRYTGDTGCVERLEDAHRLIVDVFHCDYRTKGFGRMAVVLKATQEVIGFCGLKYLEDLQEADVGYRLLPEYWGQGYATEAATAVVADGKRRLGVDRPIGLVLSENHASIRVLEKLGMVRDDEADLRDEDENVLLYRPA